MSSLRYFAEREVQNGDSYCFLIVSSFHVLIIEAPCTDLETICNYVHDFMSSGVLIPTQDCWFKHHIASSWKIPLLWSMFILLNYEDCLTVISPTLLLEATTTLSGLHPPLCPWLLIPAHVIPHLEEFLSQLTAWVAKKYWLVPVQVGRVSPQCSAGTGIRF